MADPPDPDAALAVIEDLARALDRDDLDAVAGHLADECVYRIGDEIHEGAAAITDSYRAGSALAHRLFDRVEYGHELIDRTGQMTFRVDFADRLTVNDDVLDHHSHQELTVDESLRIVQIVDVTPAEEHERVEDFMRRQGLQR